MTLASRPLILPMSEFAHISSETRLQCVQVYSNGLSEVMLGKAIRELKLPREELVIMTKVRLCSSSWQHHPADK